MRRLVTILACLALALARGVPGDCGEREDLLRENRILQSELDLARTGKLYLVFDLARPEVLVKSKGIVLRAIPIESVSVWGDPIGLSPLRLASRGALRPPTRPHLKPGDADYQPASAKPNAEPEALELKDMPGEFNLALEGGVHLTVQSRPEGFGPRLGRFASELAWKVGLPLTTLRNAYRGKPHTAGRLIMGGPEAQALYWVYPEGTPTLVRDPGR